MILAHIAVNYPVRNSLLTYKHDENESLSPGDLVVVPLGRRKANGVYWGKATQLPEGMEESKIRGIESSLENSFPIKEQERELYQWMSKYYHYSLGKLIFDSLPKIMKRPKEFPPFIGKGLETNFTMSSDQEKTLTQLYKVLDQGMSSHLIHGITGSGKSVIYLECMKKVIAAGKSVQLLLPEINLTPQFIEFFSNHLNCPIYSYHSAMKASEKWHVWKKLNNEHEPCLVLGVRSSVFLPFNSLGLIIVDEEHDHSFKQDDRCTYNARDVGVKKAQIYDCPIILGSATPSVETYYSYKNKVKENQYYYHLEERVGQANLPKVKIIDERDEQTLTNDTWPLHSESVSKIQEALSRNEQVLVYVNKLGFSSYLQCRKCGHQFQNDDCGCGLSLRYFKGKNHLSCSQCPYIEPAPEQCPECGNLKLLPKGYGTEKVQEVVQGLFPDKTIGRFDRDDINNLASLEQRLLDFSSGKIDILVGTQMLSKGHNFPNVNLVVVLGIDSQFNHPDFRATERAYQQLVQISGRSGRFSDHGEVVIQTLLPENQLFQYLIDHNWHGPYEDEVENREPFGFPPYERLVGLTFFSKKRDQAIEASSMAEQVMSKLVEHFKGVNILGPAPSPLEKRAKHFSWRILLKTKNIIELHQLLDNFEKHYSPPGSSFYTIDVDPYFLG